MRYRFYQVNKDYWLCKQMGKEHWEYINSSYPAVVGQVLHHIMPKKVFLLEHDGRVVCFAAKLDEDARARIFPYIL